MKQKIVIRVSVHDDKCRSKALKIAVAAGVESAALRGAEKDEVEVVGDGIDSVELTRRLRKKLAHAELVSVSEAKKEQNPAPAAAAMQPPYVGFVPLPYYHHYEVRDPIYDNPCTIL